MESSQAAFEDLERALGFARFTLDHHDQTSRGSREIASGEISTRLAQIPDSDDEDGLDTLLDSQQIETPSPRKDEARSITLPPTPPTPERTRALQTYHSPPRAGHAQGDLRSQPSGLSSPGVDWHSLPTPDPSPPRTRENLLLPFYLLDHNLSSHADSFRTAREGQSRAESPTSAHLFHSPGSTHTPLAMSPRASSIQGNPLAQRDTPTPPQGQEPSSSTFDPDSGDEVGQRRRSLFDVVDTPDVAPASPTVARSLSQGTAQRRLWSTIQPGDAVKRPEQSLLYMNHASPILQKRPVSQSGEIVQADVHDDADDLSPVSSIQPPNGYASREQNDQSLLDTDDLEHADPIDKGESELTTQARPVPGQDCQERSVRPSSNEEYVPIGPQCSHDEKGQSIVVRSKEGEISDPSTGTSDPITAKANDHIEDLGNQRPRTPHSVTKSSLEDNNVVYKLIREENVKRHSNISDGSVQAVVVALPEHKRTLRHTPKRHSLRGDASLTSNSHRSSAESGRKSIKRNTGTTFTASDTDLTSPDISPSIAKAALKSAPVLQLTPSTPVEAPAQGSDRRSPRDASSGANTVILARRSSGSQSTQFHPLRRRSKWEHSLDIADALHSEDDDDDDNDRDNDDDDDDAPDNPSVPSDPNGARRVGSPPMHQAAHMSSKPVYIPLADLYTPPRLRRFSNESRLERNVHVRRTSLDVSSQRTSQPLEVKLEQAAKELTREGHELLDDRHSLALTSTMTSPKRGSFDVHLHHPMHASFSVSQASMPTTVEVLEARGVTLYPHHNESLLVVQQGPRPTGNVAGHDRPRTSGADGGAVYEGSPELTGNVRPRATSVDAIGKPKYAVDSPLTNPRAPPEPPTIKFIPPTPSEELEAELILSPDHPATASIPQRRPSLSQRVRRYSEGLIQPLGLGRLGSLRRQQRRQEPIHAPQHQRASTFSAEQRPTHLSSFWHPRGFWEDVDSDEEDDGDDVFDDDDPVVANIAMLPPGGDTSHHPGRTPSSSLPLFPRNMSVRMPGFRGTGGFLQGNSLGIDRHGTNNRRPHVRWPSSEEQRRRRIADRRHARVWSDGSASRLPHLKQQKTNRPLGQHPQPLSETDGFVGSNPKSRVLTIPSFGAESPGFQVEYVGFRLLRDHLRNLRTKRADAALERRRDEIRSSIGTRVYHEGSYASS